MSSELSQRLEFYELAGKDAGMRRAGGLVTRHLDKALRRFYTKISGTPAISHLFSGQGQMDLARQAQASHWQRMFSEGLNETYHSRAIGIGNVHARIGLDPKWYVGGYALILDEVINAIVAPGLLRLLPWRRRLARDLSLVVRSSMLDMDLALSTYFVKAEERVREIVLGQMGSSLTALSSGDLTARMTGLPQDYAQAESDFNLAMGSLEEMVSAVVAGIRSMSTASAEIRAASDDLAVRNEQQAASLEETAAAMNQVTDMIKGSATKTGEVQRSIQNAYTEATDGGVVVERTITAMAAIEDSAKEINQIINVIDGIAFQTNLLALNAGVEAARAGDAGKGFAVVANEVRALAQRSADAAKDIKELITASTQQVAGGVKLVGETGELLEKIVGRVGEINTLIGEIASSSESQVSNLQQVNTSVGEMDRMTQQNAAMVEQSTAAARSLADEAGELTQLVNRFRTSQEAAPAAIAPARRRKAAPAPRVQGNLALKQSGPDEDWTEF